MDEKDSMTPDTIPQSTPVDGTVPAGRKNRRPVVIGVAAVAAIALVAGGVCGYRAYENHRVSMAREACQSAVTDLGKTVKSYKALLGADATTAALKTDATSVKDAKTLDALKQAAGVETPGMVKCDASDKTGLDEATAKADKTTKAVNAAAKALKAVESSKLDKTVADADGLYKATEGNVQDEKTREALKQAIAKRDAGAIAKAVKAVNDSKAAKEKADSEAKAKAEQEAQAQAAAEAAAQAQAQTQQSYSAPQQSYTPSYSGGSTSGGGSGSSVPDFVPSSGGYGVGSANDCDAACRAPIQH